MQVIPLMVARRVRQIRQIGFLPIANIKQIAEYCHASRCLPGPSSSQTGTFSLTEQIEQGGLQRGDSIDAQLKRPCAFAEGVKVR